MTDRHRVLIVSRELPPSIGPHPIRVAKLVKYLPEFGWDPTVLSVPVDHVVDRDDILSSEMDGTPVIRVPRVFARVAPPVSAPRTLGATHSATPASHDFGMSVKGRLARAVLIPDTSILWAIPASHRAMAIADQFDAIFTTAPPFSTHLVGDRVTRKRGIPWVAEYRDNWTMNPLYRRAGPAHWLNRRLERRCLTAASAVVVVSDHAAAELRAAFPGIGARLLVARNGYDPDDMPVQTERPAVFEIAYAGALAGARDPRPFFAALASVMADVPASRDDVRLRLIGRIADWVLEAAAAAIGPHRVVFDGMLPHRETLARCSRAAVLLGITTEAEAGGAGFTSKLFEYLGLERPVLMLAPAGPARELVQQSGGGLVADPSDTPAIAAAIRQLYEEWAAGSERRSDPSVLSGLTRRATAAAVAGALDAALAVPRKRGG
jgi:glycosyltransferase involved in cell wall biosynthesis